MKRREEQFLDFVTAVIGLIGIALIVSPSHSRRRQKLMRRYLYDTYMEMGHRAMRDGQYDAAVHCYSRAAQYVG